MAKVYGCDLGKIGIFGKDVDFYFWKGILCARRFPRKGRQPGTVIQKKTFEAMRYANQEYNRLAPEERSAFSFLASPSQMTGRDFFLKHILEEYQSLGPCYARMQLRRSWLDDESVQVTLVKPAGTPVLLTGFSEDEKRRYLLWRPIAPTLRGKRLLRRWELYDHTEDGTFHVLVDQEATLWKGTIFPESGVKFLTARAVVVVGGCYGRLGLYSVA
jgi:hypothetical protein